MEILIGFLIAAAIGLTGVGGGVLTAPILVLFLGLPADRAVGTALVFVVAVKTIAVPAYLFRRQVNFRVLGYLLAGGIPGVIIGSLLLRRISSSGLNDLVLAIVGATVVVSALLNLRRFAFRGDQAEPVTERLRVLPGAAAAIGIEVGFSSAGAGALGTLALMQWTALAPAAVVGTDLLFGFALAAVGGGFHFAAGTYEPAILIKLVTGGIAGAFIGAQMATRFPRRVLRVALSLWLMYLGSLLCYNGAAAMLH